MTKRKFQVEGFVALLIFVILVIAVVAIFVSVDSVAGLHHKVHTQVEPICSNVYIDLGTNNGKSIAEFISSSVAAAHTQIQAVIRYRDKQKLDVAGFCVYGFEPNPAHSISHAEATANHSSRVHLLKIFSETAAGPVDGWTTLMIDQYKGEYPALGSSVMTGYTGLRKTEDAKVKVRTMTFQSFFHDQVMTNLKPGGQVLVRIDVEGSESILLRDLISSGIACHHVNNLVAERHDHFLGTAATCVKFIFQWS